MLAKTTNEHGTEISVHKCAECGCVFTVCPAAKTDKSWSVCLAVGCPSWDDRDNKSSVVGSEAPPVRTHLSRLEEMYTHALLHGEILQARNIANDIQEESKGATNNE